MPRPARMISRLLLLCSAIAGCESGAIGCAGEPAATTRTPPIYQPASRPSTARVIVAGRTQSSNAQRTAPVARSAAPTTKPPPAPRQINGVWRYSNTPQFLDEYLAGKPRSRSRVRVTGAVKRGIDMGEQGGYRLWLDAGRGRFVETRFLDNGRAARAKRQGRVVTVDCLPKTKIGANARLEDCVLR